MSKRIVIDPVTRVEGHLRVEVIVENGVVIDAWTKGTMFRGLEQIIQGKDPRDAIYITERVCGVCMAFHGWTSALSLENAYGAHVPPAARLIRNLLVGALWLHNHPLHFYHLSALDYLDIMAIKDYQGQDQSLLNVKDKIMNLVQIGDTAPLTPRYEPDDFSIKDPEVVTTVLSHYLQALQVQAKAKKMSAILGGKQPHQSSIIVGGTTIYPTNVQLQDFRRLLTEVVHFVKNVYVPDVMALTTGPLLELAKMDFGQGPGNYLSYGSFAMDDVGQNKLFKAGFVEGNQFKTVNKFDDIQINEGVTSSWYRASAPVHPWDGNTDVNLDKSNAYTFIKAPRYKGRVTEVGPLARMLVNGYEPFMEILDKYKMKTGTIARHIARAQETILVADAMFKWEHELEQLLADSKENRAAIHDSKSWDTPESARGVGLTEAPRGALGHWVDIKDYKVKNYQMVVPTTWNVSPRDEKGIRGPLEQALIGIQVDENNPVNLVRIIRSFDPCLACAVHVISSKGAKTMEI